MGIFAVAAFSYGLGQEIEEGGLEGRNFDAVLGAFGACDAWSNGAEIQFDKGREVDGVFFGGDAEKVLGAIVVFDELDDFLRTSSTLEVGESFLIDGEVAHGGSIFGGHVGNGGAIREGKFSGARAIEFDKLTNDFVLAKNLSEGEGKVGGGGGGGEFASEVDADDFRGEKGERLTEHSRFGFDSADAPTHDAETVNHGGVGIGADERVGVSEEGTIGLFFCKNATGEVLEVNLVNDADAWGNDAKGLESLLAPLKEFVAFTVAFKFILHVQHEGLFGAVDVDLDGVIDDEIDGNEGFDELRIFFEPSDGIAHSGEIDEKGYASEILQNDAGDSEGNFFRGRFLCIPAGKIFDVAWTSRKAITVAKDGFEDDAEGNGKAEDVEG